MVSLRFHHSQLYTCDHGGVMVCVQLKLLCLFVFNAEDAV